MEHTFKIEKELKITTENIVDCGWPVIFLPVRLAGLKNRL